MPIREFMGKALPFIITIFTILLAATQPTESLKKLKKFIYIAMILNISWSIGNLIIKNLIVVQLNYIISSIVVIGVIQIRIKKGCEDDG